MRKLLVIVGLLAILTGILCQNMSDLIGGFGIGIACLGIAWLDKRFDA